MTGELTRILEDGRERGKPLRVGLIGAGKFGTMFLSQARSIPGLQVLGVADIAPDKARGSLLRARWPEEQFSAKSFEEARRDGTTYLTDSGEELIKADGLDVVVEATGIPAVGIGHALAAAEHGRHIVMVNVEADALVGPLLAKRANAAGLVYSMAYGDQPALIWELVEWARACGFTVVAAGKGTKYLPEYHASTPDTVWPYYGFSEEMVATGDYNPRLFNSFLDGTKSALEMAAVANATGLVPQADGLGFPACGVDDLPHILRPREDGGQLAHKGTVEVVSSIERDGRPVHNDLRYGVYVTFEAPNDYTKRCFAEYGIKTDSTGRYAAMHRPYHLIGMELSISVLRAGLRHEATGTARAFVGDVVATAKRDLAAGETLDGEGGYCVYGKLLPARAALAAGGLPIGLAHGVKLKVPVARGQMVRWADVEYDASDPVVVLRREMEQEFGAS